VQKKIQFAMWQGEWRVAVMIVIKAAFLKIMKNKMGLSNRGKK
jgi:hypothetical protein